MIKLAIGGFRGRMGRRIVELAQKDSRFKITATYDQGAETFEQPFDVLVDFSTPDGTAKFVALAKDEAAGLVIGTTGHSREQLQYIEDASAKIAILKAANFSLGIQVLLNILPKMIQELPTDFDIEIVEAHHREKVDAPSGTVLSILETIREFIRSDQPETRYGREGLTGPKPAGQIGVHSIRSGDLVGRHRIIFGGLGESITLTHEAHSRDTFARGALEAAAWIKGKPLGMYTMRDVLKTEPRPS